ncbi:MAG: Glutamate dehydrogenase, partial [Candidatus Hydrogenedentota bacterium]|jgi:glutamate dehydrogenase (NADP+)
VQGFGNAGQAVARLLHADGYRIVAVSDSSGGVYQADGFDVHRLIQVKEESRAVTAIYGGALRDVAPAQPLSNAELLELDVDLLIPSALENQITAENAVRVKAPYVVEVANGPCSSEGSRILDERGVLVVPDILANAGGVTVSYFEWTQNKAGFYWTLEEVHQRLHAIMAREFDLVYRRMKEKNIPMRTAAYAHALSRIGGAIAAKGTHAYFGNGR